jgi:hypothetical protein
VAAHQKKVAIVAKLSLAILTFDWWVGERPLCDTFFRLFKNSLQSEFLIWAPLKVVVFSWQALPERLP